MPHIVSTLSASQRYTEYHEVDMTNAKVGRPAAVKHSVLVKGGANVAGAVRTPDGVATFVSDDDLDFLQSNRHFQDHVKLGFIKVLKSDREPNADKLTKDMTKRDESSQLKVSEGDFEAGGRAGGLAPIDNNKAA